MNMNGTYLLLMLIGFANGQQFEGSFKWDMYDCYKSEVTNNDVSDRGSETVLLDATNPAYTTAKYCMAVKDENYGEFGNYETRVDVLNVASKDGINFGHLGIIFNFVDYSNYDFIYMR